ncbi:MAG: bifunctional tetrahydrofolate synthase/dihydrofolate synthase, partial [Gammaproteobacteria bacterium]|nr:bifunctional tetrahydrofolate synthase/dihydrofolate synthase [Gammaproteobacteria bacterium]
MRFELLGDWLEWQQSLNSNAIELGLERVAAVAERMQLRDIAGQVITVAGTNGKGSTVAGYETWLHNVGFS